MSTALDTRVAQQCVKPLYELLTKCGPWVFSKSMVVWEKVKVGE
jgi:hypothetical protein